MLFHFLKINLLLNPMKTKQPLFFMPHAYMYVHDVFWSPACPMRCAPTNFFLLCHPCSSHCNHFNSNAGGIPYSAHGAQIPPQPPSLIYYFFPCCYGLGKGNVCPAGLCKRYSKGTAGSEPPAAARIRKINKTTNKGRGLYVLKDQNMGESRNAAFLYFTFFFGCVIFIELPLSIQL